MCTHVFELANFPHAFFKLAHIFQVMEEEAGAVCFISAVLETPEVVMSIPRVFTLIMVRDGM